MPTRDTPSSCPTGEQQGWWVWKVMEKIQFFYDQTQKQSREVAGGQALHTHRVAQRVSNPISLLK